MGVKVGDVKFIKGNTLTVISIDDDDGWITVMDSRGAFGVCREQHFDGAEDIEPKLSDLEIVQKALVKAHKNIWCNLIFYREGWEVRAEGLTVASGDTVESLLTWAKQTIGEG